MKGQRRRTRGGLKLPLDATVTGAEELDQLKVVIASLISPNNCSECMKEWGIRRDRLTLRSQKISALVSACSALMTFFILFTH